MKEDPRTRRAGR